MPPGLTTGLGPWILAAVGLTFSLAFITTIRQLREARFSPYYLLRQQAARRARGRGLFALAAFALLVASTLWLALRGPLLLPELPTLRLPTFQLPGPSASPTLTAAPTRSVPTIPATRGPTQTPTLRAPPTRPPGPTAPGPSATAGLPQAFLTPVTPRSSPAPGAGFGAILLSAQITAGGYPTRITDTFRAGQFSVYAVFTYTNMTTGVAWTQLWLKADNTPLRGEMNLWTLRRSGTAYVFINPTEGWAPGEYWVRLFIGERLEQEKKFKVLP